MARTITMDAVIAGQGHLVIAEAYRVLGRKDPSWVEFYKVYELLRQECKGDAGLASRTGVPRSRIEALTKNSNHQVLTGDEARHATMAGTPADRDRLYLDEGRAIVSDLIQGFCDRSRPSDP